MARRYDAELIVLQVGGTEDELEEYVARVAPGATPLVRQGDDPASAIVAAAEEQKVDVVVVGSVGMAGRKEFLLGNVPNRVSHQARCTVVIVNTVEEPKKEHRWRRSR